MEKSRKLRQEEEQKRDNYLVGVDMAREELGDQQGQSPEANTLCIRPIQMYNDWVAVLQDHDEVKAGVVVKEEVLARPEGIVVGINQRGLPDGAGGWVKPQVSVGDRVAFQARSVLQGFKPAADSDSPYRGKTIVVVSERNLIYRLPGKVDFRLVE